MVAIQSTTTRSRTRSVRSRWAARTGCLPAQSKRDAGRAAAIMSLVATARANGLDPHAWLTDTLTRLPTTLDRDIDDLLPLPKE